jgi:type I restriction enzyme, S subunit
MCESWADATLGEVTSRVTRRNRVGDENTLTISAQYGLVSQEEFFQRRVASVDTREYYLLQDGDFAYNKSYSDGYPAGVVRRLDRYKAGVVSPLYICFKPDNERINSNFLKHYFESGLLDEEILWIAKEGARNHGLLNVKVIDFFSLPIKLPPLIEQRRIVEVLDALDEQITADQHHVTRLRTISRATLISELTRERHPQATLGEHLLNAPRNGYSPKEVEHWTGMIALGLGCLTSSGFEPRQLKNIPRGAAENARATLSDGDVLVSRANTRELVGMAGIYRSVGIECIYPDLMMRLRPGPDLLPEVLEHVLRLPEVRRRIQALSQGTSESMVKITGEVVTSLQIPLPSRGDQERLVQFSRATQVTIDQHERELAKLKKLKSALMDDLLTGRVRVPVEPETLAES